MGNCFSVSKGEKVFYILIKKILIGNYSMGLSIYNRRSKWPKNIKKI